eukprot:CAMPEP_0172497360 /NCGR_PEP_ID=MMETSP1066-20121228/98777_1 /TAXON_ID=671091 /ORGANISM="Coscinodiscus wailesii, Strain CCMP2513" /LENGTH=612 /DNA_ID=CAMNT_0013270079 /DNA_START=17 /DNA_END=1852 /DNA_ORIENTATION=+
MRSEVSLMLLFSPFQVTPFTPRTFLSQSNSINVWKNHARRTHDNLLSSLSSSNDDDNTPPVRPKPTTADENNNISSSMGLNELQTLLRDAIANQKFLEAAKYRDLLKSKMETTTTHLSWTSLGTAPWLVERLEAMNYTIPTTIQINAFESVNAMLLSDDSSMGGGGGESGYDESGGATLEERMDMRGGGEQLTVVVSGSTGSGKSLSFLVPALSTLSESLFQRERIRVKADEDISDAADDLLSRVAVTTSPEVRGRGSSGVGGGSLKSGGSSLGKSGSDVRYPLALIIVPTRELGVQLAMLLYEMVGGVRKGSATEFSGKRNMFRYKGPKGVKIGCVLDDSTAADGLKLQTDVAVTTPQYLTRLLKEGDIQPDKLRVIIMDEADLGLELMDRNDLELLLNPPTAPDNDEEIVTPPKGRLAYLVGASVTKALADIAPGLLPHDKTYIATATNFAPLRSEQRDLPVTNLSQLRVTLDPGLTHERCIAPENTGLLALCRLLRKELKTAHDTPSQPPPRIIIFFPSEQAARRATSQLRDALWGDYKLCVLLPFTGVDPAKVVDTFQSGDTSVMLATPNSVRGLDFQGLTHVFTLYVPVEDVREYVHLAGRVGRMGQ